MKKISGFVFLLIMSVLLFNAAHAETLDKELTAAFPPTGHKVSFDPKEPLMFIWTDSLRDHIPYSFRLVQMKPGQKPEEAVKLNTPIFQVKEINNYYVYYPWDYGMFSNNTEYAWEVSSLKDGSRMVSSFYYTESAQRYYYTLRYYNQFAELKEKLDGSYQMAYDKLLRIHYTELYHVPEGQGLRFRILDKNRQILIQTDENGRVANDVDVPRVDIRRRENWVTINLNRVENSLIDYGPFYYLEVWNGKGEYYFLRFRCDYSNPLYTYQVGPWRP